MSDQPNDAGLASPGQQPSSNGGTPPEQETLRAHLAGIEQPDFGNATLWLSDEVTTMHFPLTKATVPALLAQLDELAQDYQAPRGSDVNGGLDERDPGEPPYDAEPEADDHRERIEDEPNPGRLARWTGWHYSNSMVSRIPPQQRVALFAAVLVILLLITLFTRH
jgi:hypothetical protein